MNSYHFHWFTGSANDAMPSSNKRIISCVPTQWPWPPVPPCPRGQHRGLQQSSPGKPPTAGRKRSPSEALRLRMLQKSQLSPRSAARPMKHFVERLALQCAQQSEVVACGRVTGSRMHCRKINLPLTDESLGALVCGIELPRLVLLPHVCDHLEDSCQIAATCCECCR